MQNNYLLFFIIFFQEVHILSMYSLLLCKEKEIEQTEKKFYSLSKYSVLNIFLFHTICSKPEYL